MPILPTYPGVYVEELPSGVRPIIAVGTSVAAFVGLTARGLDHRARASSASPTTSARSAGSTADSLSSYAVSQFFDERRRRGHRRARPEAGLGRRGGHAPRRRLGGRRTSRSRSPRLSRGTWANNVVVDVDHDVPAGDARAFNLTVTDSASGDRPSASRT